MLRAQWIVDRMVEEQWIGLNRPLLVIGAGAMGASAAITAAHYQREGHRIPVIIIDQEPSPFSRQSACRTRWIDPYGYDWPASHWRETHIARAPLPLELMRVDLQWGAWLQHWQKEIEATRAITWYPQCTAAPQPEHYDSATQLWNVRIETQNGPIEVQAGAVVFCGGWGEERIRFGKTEHEGGNHLSAPFWKSDTLAELDCGLGSRTPRILIAGAGDGALQDLARAVTGLSAPQVMRLINHDLPLEWRHEIQEAADQVSRSLQFVSSTQKGELLRELHETHQRVLGKLKASPDLYQEITKIIKRQARPWLDQEGARLELVFRAPYLSPTYPLNHFVALLLQDMFPDRLFFLPGHHVVKANCRTNQSITEPAHCIGHPTDVTVVPVLANGTHGPSEIRRNFNIVVNRTGNGLIPLVQLLPHRHPHWKPRAAAVGT